LCGKRGGRGRMIPHALADAPAALTLLVAVILAALLGLAMVGPGLAVGPPPALGAAGQADPPRGKDRTTTADLSLG
jgi:hypothetical protein